MFIPGPNIVSIRLYFISAPKYSKSSSISSSLKVAPSNVPIGSKNALVPQSILIPDGPSAQQSAGIPNLSSDGVRPPNAAAVPGVTFILHIPSPLIRHMRSSSESCPINVSISIFPFATSLSESPSSPVNNISSGISLSILSERLMVLKGTFSNPMLYSHEFF